MVIDVNRLFFFIFFFSSMHPEAERWQSTSPETAMLKISLALVVFVSCSVTQPVNKVCLQNTSACISEVKPENKFNTLLPVRFSVRSSIVFSQDIDVLTDAVTQLSAVGQGLREMSDSLSSNSSCLTSTVTFLASSLQSLREDYAAWRSSRRDLSRLGSKEAGQETSCLSGKILVSPEANAVVASFAEKVEQLIESALLAIQRLVKSGEEERKRAAGKPGKPAGENKEEQEEECGLKPNHLTSLTEQLQKQVSFLHSEQASFVGKHYYQRFL